MNNILNSALFSSINNLHSVYIQSTHYMRTGSEVLKDEKTNKPWSGEVILGSVYIFTKT